MSSHFLLGMATITLGSLMLLSGCANTYLSAPVSKEESDSSSHFDGSWNGRVESRYRLRIISSAKLIGKAIICEPYEDNITIAVNAGKVDVEIGSASRYHLSTSLDSEGRFYQSMTLTAEDGSNPRHGTELSVTGELNSDSGQAKGYVGIAPQGHASGCVGDFRLRRNGTVSPVSSAPFTPAYHIMTLSDDS